MDRLRSHHNSPRSSQPSRQTPRPSDYQNLLKSFGTRSSATSATKARRVSSMGSPWSQTPTPHSDGDDNGHRDSKLPGSRADQSKVLLSSPDQLQSSTEPAPSASPLTLRARPTTRNISDELKMEKRTRARERSDRPRRSLRSKAAILESDTMVDELSASPLKKKAVTPRKLDTARQRLREDIAQRVKTKSNNFLVAHQDYFCPLLPASNHITKLAANIQHPQVEPYVELTEQPQGVTATMKPYQLSGLSFLSYLNRNGMSGILGDEMGLGKTLQTLSMFQYLEEQDRKSGIVSEELRPYLVVCPLSVLNSWVSEAQKWVPELRIIAFYGTANERKRLKKVVAGMEDSHGHETRQYHDRKASRKAGLNVSKLPTADLGSDSFRIVVTTYETFVAEQSWFKHSFIWRYVVLDEGHKIKNTAANVSSALKNISSEYRLILTGTPLQNNLQELWALLVWLFPDVFVENTKALFSESFDLAQGKVNKQTMDDSRRLLELVMLRRMKDSPGVDLNLPPKEEVLLYVPLTPMQRFWYTRLLTRAGDNFLEDIFGDIESKEKQALRQEKRDDEMHAKLVQLEKVIEETGPVADKDWEETAAVMRDAMEKEQAAPSTRNAWLKLMNLVMQLRKCCSHPYQIPGAIADDYETGRHVIHASGKFIVLEKLLKHRVFEQGKKVLIFSGFTRTLDLCEELLDLIGSHGRGFRFLRLDGGTSRARRNLGIRMFNNPKSDYKVMLLSTRAGGLGINLTSAEDVVFLDEDWNPQITLQAEARAHRIGQTKKVTIFKLCTQGTVEEQMMGRIRKKLYLSTKITESMRNIHSAGVENTRAGATTEDMPQMSTTQLMTLVRRGAQTLSHPKIDETEMLSWDFDTILQRCRDKPADVHGQTNGLSEVDEEQWLSAMERVQTAVWDGKRYQRQLDKVDTKEKIMAANILPDTISREDRRKGKNVTVTVDGFSISKASLNCAEWEAVSTLAGKDPRLAEVKRERKHIMTHEAHCLVCFGDEEQLTGCIYCPRSAHMKCLDQPSLNFNQFTCPQHSCKDCGKKTADAGGLIFRCRWCEHGYCEDCLEWGKEELIGENLIEFEMLGEDAPRGGYYISCPECEKKIEEDTEHGDWLSSMKQSYDEQYEQWLKDRDIALDIVDREFEEKHRAADGLHFDVSSGMPSGAGESPPALTNGTSPAADSGISTPVLPPAKYDDGAKRKTSRLSNGNALGEELRKVKKARR